MNETEQSEETLNRIHRETGIAKEALRMIESGIEEMKAGNVSDPVNVKKDFPELFNNQTE